MTDPVPVLPFTPPSLLSVPLPSPPLWHAGARTGLYGVVRADPPLLTGGTYWLGSGAVEDALASWLAPTSSLSSTEPGPLPGKKTRGKTKGKRLHSGTNTKYLASMPVLFSLPFLHLPTIAIENPMHRVSKSDNRPNIRKRRRPPANACTFHLPVVCPQPYSPSARQASPLRRLLELAAVGLAHPTSSSPRFGPETCLLCLPQNAAISRAPPSPSAFTSDSLVDR